MKGNTDISFIYNEKRKQKWIAILKKENRNCFGTRSYTTSDYKRAERKLLVKEEKTSLRTRRRLEKGEL
jgi:hypothetical protein